MSVQLRLATPDDLERIAQLEADLFGSDAWSVDLVAAELAAPWTDYFIAFDSAAPALALGYGGVSVPAAGAPADIQTIAVIPEARRRGIGRILLLALAEAGQRRGATESLLEVRADNPAAQALYAQLGYAAIAVRPRYYQPDDVDAIVMRAVLPLSVTTGSAA